MSKEFHAVFMSCEARSVWSKALQGIPDLPSCPLDMSEPQYASLIFERRCHVISPSLPPWSQLTSANPIRCATATKPVFLNIICAFAFVVYVSIWSKYASFRVEDMLFDTVRIIRGKTIPRPLWPFSESIFSLLPCNCSRSKLCPRC